MATIPTVQAPARQVPVLADVDVLVCGGGPAGCAAATAAARHGADTLLIERDGHLGGATVAQLVVVVLSTNGVDFQGIWHEYARRLIARDAMRPMSRTVAPGRRPQIRSAVDPEAVKFVWDEIVTAAGVRLLHHAHVSGCLVEDGAATTVILETKAGTGAIRARRIIDTTGDGIVCHHAGVPWDQGDGRNRYAMACTKVFRMGGVQRPANWPDKEAIAQAVAELSAAIERGEFDAPVLTELNRWRNYAGGWNWALPERRRELLSVLSRVLKVDPLDPWDFTRAEREGREQARQGAEAYRRFMPGFEQAYLLDTSAHLGVRSSRRVRGLDAVTDADAIEFRKRPDAIARSSWDLDVWPAESYSAPAVDDTSDAAKVRMQKLREGDYFDIPYGAVVAQGVDNLLMAGRCLSASHLAESSLRIQQTCMATGQAAGVTAALSLRAGATPRELDPKTVVEQLARDRDVEPAFDVLRDLPMASR